MSDARIEFGLDRLLRNPSQYLRGRRYAVLANHASLDQQFRFSGEALQETREGELCAVLAPQHGLWGERQANMIESPHEIHDSLGVPVHSLYCETRQPTDEMLDGIELLLVDLQDVGTRVYTFAWTLLLTLQACARRGIRVIVLDRPNPLGGERLEGPHLEASFKSFVGLVEMPMRHGLTLGELALWFRSEASLDVDLHVVPVEPWQRDWQWERTGRTWIGPSPNVPSMDSVRLYPGMVLLEGTTLSEGRGTTLPFQVCGAPSLSSRELASDIARRLPDPLARPARFLPTFDKFEGITCNGVRWHLVDPVQCESFRAAILLLSFLRQDHLQCDWLSPPYEYEYDKMPIDILYGSDRLRVFLDDALQSRKPVSDGAIDELCRVDTRRWHDQVAEFRLYS